MCVKIMIKIFLVITYYIDKVSSPLRDDFSKAREALRYFYPASIECAAYK